MSIRLNLFYLLLLLFNTLFAQENYDERTKYFPNETVLVEKMPDHDSLWIFFMAGQSNMAGRGSVEPRDTVLNKRIITLNKDNNWIYAKEPLHFYEPDLAGLDCGVSFANTLLDSIPNGITVALVPCAVGGSSIKNWVNDDFHRGVHLLSNFRTRMDFSAKCGKIKGILWHQGESDSGSKGISVYSTYLDTLFQIFRNIARNDSLPVIMGELGTFAEPLEKQMRRDTINMIIHDFAQKNSNIYVIETDDLKDKGDKLHFNSNSQRIIGERFALKVIMFLL